MIAPASFIAGQLADFIEGLSVDAVPPDVLEKARRCLLYGVGIGLCSFPTGFATVAAAAAVGIDGDIPDGASIFRSGRRSTVGAAALANAALFHGRCQEDTCGTAHIGAIVIPLILGLIEARRIGVDRLLPALIAGYEVGGALEALLAKRTMANGFRATPLYGVLAAAAAASKLLDLSRPAIEAALAHAASFAGGTLQSIVEGTDEWRYQAGVAAQLGLVAAELARANAQGARAAFEGEQGFARVFAGETLGDEVRAHLGQNWSLRRVTFKPYPVCAHNQSIVMAAIGLAPKLDASSVRKLEIHVNPYIVPGMDGKGPFTRVAETLMSSAFCAATGLLRGTLDIDHLAAFDDEAVAGLVGRAALVADPEVPFPACRLRATLASGAVVTHEARIRFEDFDFPRDDVIEQLRRIGRSTDVPAALIEELAAFVDELPTGDIDAVLDIFARLRRHQASRED